MVGALPCELLDKIKADGKKGGLVALGFGQFAWLSFFFPPKNALYIHICMIYLRNICCNTRNCIALDPNILLHDLTGFVSMEHQEDLHMFLVLQRPRSHKNE